MPRGRAIGPTGVFTSPVGGFASIAFELVIGVFISLLSSASLGMPGIGGVFFGSGLPLFLESVMPGIGLVEFDTAKLAAFGFIPGAELVIIEGVPENSGGILAAEAEFDSVTETAFLFTV